MKEVSKEKKLILLGNFEQGNYATKIIQPRLYFATKLTQFICMYLYDVLEFFGIQNVKISNAE